jgi:AcrR family transcriptional regulator
VSDRPFHHGNLRVVLLDRAEEVLRKDGIDALSLRQLARDAGVSHGAPRSHFIDRNALLDALAERGFLRLSDEVSAAATSEPDDFADALCAVVSAYVHFAVQDAALLDLMFAAKFDGPSEPVRKAAERLITTTTQVMERGVRMGAIPSEDVPRLTLLVSAMAKGIASLVASGQLPIEQGDALIHDAVAYFVSVPVSRSRGRQTRGENVDLT